MTIYEKLVSLIPEVKTIENADTKKRLTFKIKSIMDEIKSLKEEYESLGSENENIFFNKKEKLESIITNTIEEIENIINLQNEDLVGKHM